MKRIVISLCLVVIIAGMGGCMFLQRIVIKGDTEILQAIRSLRPGTSSTEVNAFMKRRPQVFPASRIPAWMNEIVPQRDKGEYWVYFMGYPPRNLIIYIDADQKVGYVTWHHT